MKKTDSIGRFRWLALLATCLIFSCRLAANASYNNHAPAFAPPVYSQNGSQKGQTGDVFSTNTRGGNSTKTTGTQGVNHGKGGNKTNKTGKNIPKGLPDVFSTKGGNKGGPILSGKTGVITDVAGSILDKTGKSKPKSTRTQKIPGLPGMWSCVDMKNSRYPWDRWFADTDDRNYNCHYYTRAAMGLVSRSGTATSLNTKSLLGMGYRKVDLSRAQVGDIILVDEPSQGGGVSTGYSHSGIVTDAINGSINNIRQKASPYDCVIDTSFYDFKSAFGRDLKYVSLWRKN